ncbi:CPBP family intramembrane glutamic endopeptidase [Pseudoteredinibacter isoporae]|uniref:CPBP family intramembrane glutamic endopeptidase n=1 Tax=Pseudoteredinibacter isoporae TaxID=570281 RepID=UPI0031049E18
MQSKFWGPIGIFTVTFISVLLLREYSYHQLFAQGITDYSIHTSIGIMANILIVAISYWLIKANDLFAIAGLKGKKTEKWYLLLFPLVYLVSLNLLIADEPSADTLFSQTALFIVYCLSIGFAEELSIRGFLQSYFVKYFGGSKKGVLMSILLASLFFGVVHLIKFDSGLYGEIAQLFYASFIGLMFGILLIVCKRIYPLIIVHALIDFFADIGEVGLPVQQTVADPVSMENALLIVILTLPCLIYALILMYRYRYEAIE